jgi:hypothetical protein
MHDFSNPAPASGAGFCFSRAPALFFGMTRHHIQREQGFAAQREPVIDEPASAFEG